jgi:hypothetical protein
MMRISKRASLLLVGSALHLGATSVTQAATDCNAVTEISPAECESLLELYHSTNGANWENNGGWNETNTPCSWYGITCENNGVVGINFDYGNNLVGNIPDFSGFPNLQELSLAGNQLTGKIPDFSTLPNLNSFNIGDNQLTGTIDCQMVTEISQIECESLLQLYNSTDGSNWTNNYGWNVTNKPCSWHGITCKNNGVIEINLSGRYDFDSGYLGNNLVGTIPNFKGLPNLRTFSLNSNQLTGKIPDFSGMRNLQALNLASNQLTGKIPDFSNLSNLQGLSLYNNQLTSAIPNFSGLPNLRVLSLSGNQLTGKIPDLSGLPNLQTLSLEANQLTTVQITLEKESYRPGEHFKAELVENFSEGYDLYVAVLLPNGVDFITLENTNKFAPLNQPQKWLAPRVQNEGPITLLDLTLPADLATGEYCFYGILSPQNESVLEVAEQWVMDWRCVEINTTN